jgi:hypothetical protein
MAYEGGGDYGKAERFRAAVLPYLDDVYTLARYLLRNAADAEDAAQECYLRAFRHFETFRGGPIKPWLLAILPSETERAPSQPKRMARFRFARGEARSKCRGE